MKRLLLGALVVLMVVGFAGCSKNETGGLGKQRDVTQEDITIFNNALGEDVKLYKPLKVQTQVVSGTNYKFYVETLTSKETKHLYITIYVSLDANEPPKVTEKTEAK